MRRLKRLSTSSAALLALSVLALGVLAATTLSALADHNVHPPGWNKPDPNVPTSLFDFRSGWGWDDYQRLLARSDNARRFPASRPTQTGPVIYGMTPRGHRYHQAQ